MSAQSSNVSFSLVLEDTTGQFERSSPDYDNFGSLDDVMKHIKETLLGRGLEYGSVNINKLRKIEIWINKGEDNDPVDNDIIWSENSKGDIEVREK